MTQYSYDPERAKALIAVVGSDSDNLYITLSARLLNAKLLIVARAEEEDAQESRRRGQPCFCLHSRTSYRHELPLLALRAGKSGSRAGPYNNN